MRAAEAQAWDAPAASRCDGAVVGRDGHAPAVHGTARLGRRGARRGHQRGPITAGEASPDGVRRKRTDPDPDPTNGRMWNWQDAKIAIEYLFCTSRVAIAGRRNFERLYDLSERVLPSAGSAGHSPLRTRLGASWSGSRAKRSASPPLGSCAVPLGATERPAGASCTRPLARLLACRSIGTASWSTSSSRTGGTSYGPG
jgi:hypothetical protein